MYCSGKTQISLVLGLSAAVLLAASSVAAADILLEDNNAELRIDPNADYGMWSWDVDGVDHLFQQWFWYRIGDSGGEQSIDTIPVPSVLVQDLDFDAGNEVASIAYQSAEIKVELKITLEGGAPGSNAADILENIRITNTGGSQQQVHFFEYCDLDVGFDEDDDVAWIDPVSSRANQTDGGTAFVSETITSGPPSHYQVDYYPDLLDDLEDASPTTLSDDAGPLGPDDVVWAFQWDFTLDAGQSAQVTKNKLIVPEPSVLLLLLCGSAPVFTALRRRRAAGR